MFFLVYDKSNGEMINLSFTKDESGANAFKSEKLDAVEIPESFYSQLLTNKQFAYVKGDEIILRPPAPYQYAKWNVNIKNWELDVKYQLASETELAREKRNELLIQIDNIVNNPLRWNELSLEKQDELKQYRIDLLNVSQQSGFPLNIIWPTQPS